MLRVPLRLAHIKRTIRPLYMYTQATPKSCYLDPNWDRSVPIYPGMVAMRTSGENYSLINATGSPAGLFGLYIGGDNIDELLDTGINALAVWVLGPDAEFEILAPAFDTTADWTDPGDGTEVLVGGATTGANRGKLVPVTDPAKAVGRLLKVNSANKITIGGLSGRSA